MYFLPILLVCSLAPGFTGDADTGATCVKFRDQGRATYTEAQCSTRLRAMFDEITGNEEALSLLLPGPWRYRGSCQGQVIDEVRLG